MSIILTLPDDFTIENYTGLQDFLIVHLQLDSETVEQLPNLIRLAEYRLNRLVLAPERETTATLTTTAATQAVALPPACRQVKQLKLIGDQSTGYPLEQVSQNVVEQYDYAGKPLAFSIVGSNALLGPIPDAAYSLTLTYIAKLTPLTSNAQSNWLLSSNADAYIYMASSVISFHLGDESAASTYNSLAESVMAEINDQGNRKRVSAPMRLRSPVVV